MKIKQTLILLLAVFGLFAAVIIPTATVSAESECGGVKTSIIKCDEDGNPANGVKDSGVWALLIIIINILTAGVGILAVGGIVYGSIMYTSAGGNAEQVKKATTILTNVVIGLVAYAAMYALLNFIVPGGLFAT